ncbi:MAG: CaiB/BaiF CoA transferase family protein [Acidimicrobiales bacterium]
MRILDLTQYEAGPSATQALAFMGADVVKVERPAGGDPGRSSPVVGHSYFVNWNCNKRSLALDVAEPAGRELFLRLAPSFDVVVENFGPGVIERLELGYEHVRAVHPSVIYASVKGFGADGPYAAYKCFDAVAQAMSGAFSVTGEPDGPPTAPGPTIADCGTGMQLAAAILAAYVQKLRTGEGQRVELSMQEAMTYYMRTRLAFSDWGAQAVPRLGAGINSLMALYACRPFGPNDYVQLMALPAMFPAVCTAMGRPELLERFTGAALVANDEALTAEIAAWTAQRTKYEAMHELAAAGVPAGAVLDTKDLHEDPHLLARGFVKRITHPELGELPVLGWPARLSASDTPLTSSPLLGQHTDAVLAEAGLDAEEVAALRAKGVLA